MAPVCVCMCVFVCWMDDGDRVVVDEEEGTDACKVLRVPTSFYPSVSEDGDACSYP